MTLAISLPPDASAADNLSELRPSYAERRAGVAALEKNSCGALGEARQDLTDGQNAL
jgi:hypothetical protein